MKETIPQSMNALRLHTPGGASGLVYERIDTPRPKPGEVLVRVHAAAITRGELEWPVDRLPAIPSYEFSGVVVAAASDMNDVALGEEVYALTGFDRDGAAADYTIVRKEVVARKPRTLSHIESATIPLAALTAWQALFDHGELRVGQRVLIHGAVGGVGSMAVQLAHGRGAHVIGTASTGSLAIARRLGADEVVDHKTMRFEDIVDEVDLVFDTVGGEALERSPAVLRRGGRLISIASTPSQDRAAERGIAAIYFIVEPNRAQLIEITKLVDNYELQPTVAEVFALKDGRSAFARSLDREHRGKVVLSVIDGDA
jgi:NADPH:quinone reductase-like Zn-dependent oxidoreductase